MQFFITSIAFKLFFLQGLIENYLRLLKQKLKIELGDSISFHEIF